MTMLYFWAVFMYVFIAYSLRSMTPQTTVIIYNCSKYKNLQFSRNQIWTTAFIYKVYFFSISMLIFFWPLCVSGETRCDEWSRPSAPAQLFGDTAESSERWGCWPTGDFYFKWLHFHLEVGLAIKHTMKLLSLRKWMPPSELSDNSFLSAILDNFIYFLLHIEYI